MSIDELMMSHASSQRRLGGNCLGDMTELTHVEGDGMGAAAASVSEPEHSDAAPAQLNGVADGLASDPVVAV